jgi:hypothetical protein
MPQMLPLVPLIPHYRVGTELAGIQYLLDVRWNERDSAWYLSLMAEDETPIRMGMKIVLGTMLGVRSAHPLFPPGAFMASDLSGKGRDATLTDLGTRVVVYFFTNDELNAL